MSASTPHSLISYIQSVGKFCCYSLRASLEYIYPLHFDTVPILGSTLIVLHLGYQNGLLDGIPITSLFPLWFIFHSAPKKMSLKHRSDHITLTLPH